MSSDPKTARAIRYYGDDEDESHLAPDVAKRAAWRNNPMVPLG